jgi:hypothetical protein
VDQEHNPRERSFIRELVPRWSPTRNQVLWAIRITIAVVIAVAVVALLGVVLWRVLDTYIDPTSATEKKGLVQSFAVQVPLWRHHARWPKVRGLTQEQRPRGGRAEQRILA